MSYRLKYRFLVGSGLLSTPPAPFDGSQASSEAAFTATAVPTMIPIRNVLEDYARETGQSTVHYHPIVVSEPSEQDLSGNFFHEFHYCRPFERPDMTVLCVTLQSEIAAVWGIHNI